MVKYSIPALIFLLIMSNYIVYLFRWMLERPCCFVDGIYSVQKLFQFLYAIGLIYCFVNAATLKYIKIIVPQLRCYPLRQSYGKYLLYNHQLYVTYIKWLSVAVFIPIVKLFQRNSMKDGFYR